MKWTKPEFKEISVSMEATAYVNTDSSVATVKSAAAVPSKSQTRESKTAASLAA